MALAKHRLLAMVCGMVCLCYTPLLGMVSKDTLQVKVPSFYLLTDSVVADTTYRMLCYNSRNDTLTPDPNFDSVSYISLWKAYIDYAHSYKDNDGTKKPLPISQIVVRYDKAGNNRWLYMEYATKKYAEFIENKDRIVHTRYRTLPGDRVVQYNVYQVRAR
ncbi:MAG: hypothetical protein EBX41_04580 [Chitinophagia bacterium]|nr:hypothetical protein [Chitinophagia bacterium]